MRELKRSSAMPIGRWVCRQFPSNASRNCSTPFNWSLAYS